MDNKQRPSGRKKNVTGSGKTVYRRGEGLGTGPVGNSGGPQNFNTSHKVEETGRRTSGRGLTRGGGALTLVAIAAALLFGGNNLFGGGGGSQVSYSTPTPQPTAYVSTTPAPSSSTSGINFGINPNSYSNVFAGSTSTEVTNTDTAEVDTEVEGFLLFPFQFLQLYIALVDGTLI